MTIAVVLRSVKVDPILKILLLRLTDKYNIIGLLGIRIRKYYVL